MQNLKYLLTELFWMPKTVRGDLVNDNLRKNGISLTSLNDALDTYIPESAGRFPEIIEQYSDLPDIILASISRFKRENAQKLWDREERRDRLRVYLAVNIADYVSMRPEAFRRVIQVNMPLPSYAQ